MENPFRRLATLEIHRNPYFHVRQDDVVHISGRRGPYYVVDLKPGATVLALTDDQQVYAIREFKYAVDRACLELPAGGIEEGEEPLQAAQRELREEGGLTAERWTPLGTVDPFTSVVRSPQHLYLAQGLTRVAQQPDELEVISVVPLPLADLVERVLSGEMTHGPSALAIMKVHELLRTGRLQG